MKPFVRNTLLLISLVLLDQLLKLWIITKRLYIDVAGLAAIHFVQNTGASFGILKDNNALLAWVSVIVLGIIMMLVDRIRKEQVIPVLLVVAGLLGNLIDRVFRGFVIDFVDLKFWPVFNLADSLICIGVIWLGIVILVKDINENKQKIRKGKK
jgi:signal peptidase II